MTTDPFTTFRRALHAHPELSGSEHQTHDRIAAFLADVAPSAQIHTHLAHTGLAAVINPTAKSTIVYRADTDALPIYETSGAPHTSTIPAVAHSCGHDGHTAIACALAHRFHTKPLPDTRLVLLFQPAEETGAGAQALLGDDRLRALIPDPESTRLLAIHNLPGVDLGKLVLIEGPMCPASLGLRAVLTGNTGHSSQPNPRGSALTIAASLVDELPTLPRAMNLARALITPTHLASGDDHQFGITPGSATLGATLRAMHDDDLDALLTRTLDTIHARAATCAIAHTIHERFAATINDPTLARDIIAAAKAHALDHEIRTTPMPWSEDVGRFSELAPTMLIGIGAGTDTPPLHASDYDYPDELTDIATDTLERIIRTIA
jgi:amidohydrolase